MVDKQKKLHVSYAIGSKSVSDWIVKRLCDDLESWGHTGKDIMIRCDGEPSIRAMRKALGAFRSGNMVPEDIPPGEHEQMGFVEAHVKSTRNQFKTLRSASEENIGQKVPMDAHIMQWMVRWAAMLLSRFCETFY